MFKNAMVSKILSVLAILILVFYIVGMLFSEAAMILLSPFGLVVLFGYICLIIGLTRQRIWALEIFFILILATIIMIVIFVATIGLENIGEMMASMFFYMSLFILPVFGISAVIRRIIKK